MSHVAETPPRRLRVFAPAKVNLSLRLGPLRADGRHELVTLFQSLAFGDELSVSVLPAGSADLVRCEPPIAGENLAARALRELRGRGWRGPPLEVVIRKRIPVAGGMAGGSADAAATLRAAAALAPVAPAELESLAGVLGADVPAQLRPGASIGRGAGEQLERLAALSTHAYVVVPSPCALATADVFGEADRQGLARTAAELRAHHAALSAAVRAGGPLPARLIVNDLQAAAISLCPWCADALGALRDAGAPHTLVSGSGPTVVGIWCGDGAYAQAASAAERLRAELPGTQACRPVQAESARPALTSSASTA